MRFGASPVLPGWRVSPRQTDLANELPEETVASQIEITADPAFGLRVVPAFVGMSRPADDGVEWVRSLIPRGNERLHYGLVKLVLDGSIQGFTARLEWPGYYNGAPNGLWYIDPDQLPRILASYHNAGLQVHIHTNGDQATGVAIDAIEAVQRSAPAPGARFTLQHCQMAHDAHFRRMAKLGICANLFSNHLFYWGEQHRSLTMGPERAERMDAAASAKRFGVDFAIHSDAPVTHLAPLFTAWCAINRVTAAGRVLGDAERISVHDALHAITLGAAYTLKLDGEIGSIETGKCADFTILDDDPLSVESNETERRTRCGAPLSVGASSRAQTSGPSESLATMMLPIPMSVIGGFLGAGKTTLLNRLLQEAQGTRYAVLVNDFGDLAIDGDLVSAHGGDTVTFANGCVCCTLGDGLLETIDRLLATKEPPQHFLVEASGVADPLAIADLATLHPDLRRDLVLVLADVSTLCVRAQDPRLADTVICQLRAADLIVLNKCDLVDDSSRDETYAWLRQHSDAAIVTTTHAAIALEVLHAGNRTPCASSHGRSHAHSPQDVFATKTVPMPNPVDLQRLTEQLKMMMPSLLRAKGFVYAADAPLQPLLLQVSGRRVDIAPWQATPAAPDVVSALVLIGLDDQQLEAFASNVSSGDALCSNTPH